MKRIITPLVVLGFTIGFGFSQLEKNPLDDTEWRLVEFQSMDDSIGTVKPNDPSLYTMRLNGDGTVNMRLNCNRANGTWSAEPSSDGTSGRFEFGPLAGTRALCPPPSMDEQVMAHSKWVRSFFLKDGNLYLSLMADGGIYAWEPIKEVLFETVPDKGLEAAILDASPDYTREIVENIRAVGNKEHALRTRDPFFLTASLRWYLEMQAERWSELKALMEDDSDAGHPESGRG